MRVERASTFLPVRCWQWRIAVPPATATPSDAGRMSAVLVADSHGLGKRLNGGFDAVSVFLDSGG
jgi:hypothetical protein